MPLPPCDWPVYHVVYTSDRPKVSVEFDIRLNPEIIDGLKSEDRDTIRAAQRRTIDQVRSRLSSRNRCMWRDGSLLWRNLQLKEMAPSK